MSTRLPGPKYKKVFDRGRFIKGRFIVGWYLVSDDADRLAGVVVSKKTFAAAVDRNRAKRLVREAYRLLVAEGAMPKGCEWVYVIRRAILGAKCAEVKAEMLRISSLAFSYTP